MIFFINKLNLQKSMEYMDFVSIITGFLVKDFLKSLSLTIFNDKKLDFPFMLCWANEPWTRAWDGSENEILMPQNFEKEDYLKFIEDIMPFFKDERYIKINNCPILIIYRPHYIPKRSHE